MTLPVKWFHSAMTGAPAAGTAVHTLVGILDACLVDGFNTQGLDSLAYDSGAGRCTATVGAGHGYVDHQVVLIAGADQAGYNGEARVTVVDATTFTYAPDAAPAATPATGVITAKAAPVGGWSKAFSGTDKAAYHSADPLYSGCYLRLDDSVGADGAAVSAFEAMTDVDTGSGEFGAGWWRKSDGANTMDEWALVGDSRAFYLMLGGGAGAARSILFFGDYISFAAGDGYHCALTRDTAASGGTMNGAGCIGDYGVSDGHTLMRDLLASTASAAFVPHGMTQQGIHPDAATGGVVAAAGVMMFEPGVNSWRGHLPGSRSLLSPLHAAVAATDGGLLFALQGRNRVAIDLEAWDGR